MNQPYTFSVTATGDNLNYQWYFNGNPLNGETNNTLTLADPISTNSGLYYVVISNMNGEITSDEVTLSVTEPLPVDLQFIAFPNTVKTNSTYLVEMEEHNQVSDYVWGLSNDKVSFMQFNDPAENIRNRRYIQTGSNKGSCTLTVTLLHVCGNRSVSKTIYIDTPTGIESVDSKAQLYPNPVQDVLTIESHSSIKNLIVSDMNGRTVYQSQPRKDNLQIQVDKWSKGTYLVRIVTEQSATVHKIIKK